MTRKRKHIIPFEILNLEQNNYHILINSTFEDGSKGKWTIDTGASKSVFDVNLTDLYINCDSTLDEMKSAGITESKIETSAGVISSLSIENFIAKNIEVALIDLNHINSVYKQFTNNKIVGLIGSDFLVRHNAIINFKALTITLYI